MCGISAEAQALCHYCKQHNSNSSYLPLLTLDSNENMESTTTTTTTTTAMVISSYKSNDYLFPSEVENEYQGISLDILRKREKNKAYVTSSLYLKDHESETSGFSFNARRRLTLIKWLVGYHLEIEMMWQEKKSAMLTDNSNNEVLHMAVNYIDRYFTLNQKVVKKEHFHAIGVVCYRLAYKMHGGQSLHFPMDTSLLDTRIGPDLIYDRMITAKVIKELEIKVLTALENRLNCVTAKHWIHLFMKAATKSVNQSKLPSHDCFKKLCHHLCDLTLLTEDSLDYSPSLVAASVIYYSIFLQSGKMLWNEVLQYYTCYSEEQLQECTEKCVRKMYLLFVQPSFRYKDDNVTTATSLVNFYNYYSFYQKASKFGIYIPYYNLYFSDDINEIINNLF